MTCPTAHSTSLNADASDAAGRAGYDAHSTPENADRRGSYEAVRNSQPRRRDLARQLLDAIEAWEDALTDDERQAQQEQAQALLDRLVGGRDDMTDSVPQAQARWRVLWMPAHRDPLLPPNVYSECQHKDCVLADLAYLRAEKGDSEAWIEQRLATPWERTR